MDFRLCIISLIFKVPREDYVLLSEDERLAHLSQHCSAEVGTPPTCLMGQLAMRMWSVDSVTGVKRLQLSKLEQHPSLVDHAPLGFTKKNLLFLGSEPKAAVDSQRLLRSYCRRTKRYQMAGLCTVLWSCYYMVRSVHFMVGQRTLGTLQQFLFTMYIESYMYTLFGDV